MQEFPRHARVVHAGLERRQELRRPLHSILRRHALEKTILEPRERLRDAKLAFVYGVIAAMDGAAHRAAAPLLPVGAFHDLIGSSMGAYAPQILRLDLLVAVECQHLCSPVAHNSPACLRTMNPGS